MNPEGSEQFEQLLQIELVKRMRYYLLEERYGKENVFRVGHKQLVETAEDFEGPVDPELKDAWCRHWASRSLLN